MRVNGDVRQVSDGSDELDVSAGHCGARKVGAVEASLSGFLLISSCGVKGINLKEGWNVKRWMIGVGLAAVGFCAGCTSPVKKVDVNRGLEAFYTQPRTVDLLSLRGTNMTVTYTGVTEYKVASILPPLNAIPREPGVLEKIVDGVVGLGKWGFGWYYGSQIMTSALQQPRTVDPIVVQPTVVNGAVTGP